MAKSVPVLEKSEDTPRAFLLLFPLLRNNIKIARVSVFSVFLIFKIHYKGRKKMRKRKILVFSNLQNSVARMLQQRKK